MGVCAPHTPRRPGERRDPYSVTLKFERRRRRHGTTTTSGGYGSRRSPGRLAERFVPRSQHAFTPRGATRPSFCKKPSPKEGVGNAGRTMHPRSRVHLVVVKGTRVTTSTPKSPGIPARNGFNGLLRTLPGDRALLPPSPCGLKVLSDPVEPNAPPQDLTPASRRQDHTTSPSASSAVVLHAANRSRRAIRPALRFARLTLLRPPHLIPRS